MELRTQPSAARDLWLNLVRAACLTQEAGYPGAITVSRRFNADITAFELGQFSRFAERMAEEYGLTGSVVRDGSSLSIRISRGPVEAEATPATTTSEAEPHPARARQPEHHVPALLRFLRIGQAGRTREVHS